MLSLLNIREVEGWRPGISGAKAQEETKGERDALEVPGVKWFQGPRELQEVLVLRFQVHLSPA